MILYKYRSLSNFEHVADIILNERLYCSTYDRLNDPFEGLSVTIWTFTFRKKSLTQRHAFPVRYEEILKNTRVCCLSSSLSDVRLWSYYSDGHKGITLEIDFTGIESHIHKVVYSSDLSGFDNPTRQELLSRKTNHWEYEAEYRIIHDEEYFPINKRIKTIYLGNRISPTHRDLLKRMVSDEIEIYNTRLNVDKVQIEPGKLLNKNGT